MAPGGGRAARTRSVVRNAWKLPPKGGLVVVPDEFFDLADAIELSSQERMTIVALLRGWDVRQIGPAAARASIEDLVARTGLSRGAQGRVLAELMESFQPPLLVVLEPGRKGAATLYDLRQIVAATHAVAGGKGPGVARAGGGHIRPTRGTNSDAAFVPPVGPIALDASHPWDEIRKMGPTRGTNSSVFRRQTRARTREVTREGPTHPAVAAPRPLQGLSDADLRAAMLFGAPGDERRAEAAREWAQRRSERRAGEA